MKKSAVNWWCALAIATVPIAAVGQIPQAATKPPNVSLPFFADDTHGAPISEISQSDLLILDNKRPPGSVIGLRAAKDLPLRIGALIDTSTSQRQSRLYQPGLQGVVDLVNRVMRGAEDRAFVLTFSASPNATPFMNHEEVQRLKVDLTLAAGTALFDSVYLACKKMEGDQTEPARRVLVILSDGGDNVSQVNHDKAIAAAQESGTVIFAVSTREDSGASMDSRRLEQFADKTGGRAFLHLGRKDISKALSTIEELIENMWTVTYVPAEPATFGQYHSIELKAASEKKVKLRAPKGYYVAPGRN